MLAKIIAFGENRETATRRLAAAVQDTQLLGVNHNKLFLQNVLRHDVFTKGEATTAFIEQHFTSDVSMDQKTPGVDTLARAAILFYQRDINTSRAWRKAAQAYYHFRLDYDGSAYEVMLTEDDGAYVVTVGEESRHLALLSLTSEQVIVLSNNLRSSFAYAFRDEQVYIDDGRGHFVFDNITHRPAEATGGAGSGLIKASMDGAIVEVLVKDGDWVEAGQTIVVLEAMKMEHQLKSGIAGTVASINTQAGQQVKTKQLLASITAAEEAEA